MRADATANITLLSGKELYPFPDNKCMKLYIYENQLDFRFLTNTASISILHFKINWYIWFINTQFIFVDSFFFVITKEVA